VRMDGWLTLFMGGVCGRETPRQYRNSSSNNSARSSSSLFSDWEFMAWLGWKGVGWGQRLSCLFFLLPKFFLFNIPCFSLLIIPLSLEQERGLVSLRLVLCLVYSALFYSTTP
jgi:hypothetical protein